jgi:hypothetical protein
MLVMNRIANSAQSSTHQEAAATRTGHVSLAARPLHQFTRDRGAKNEPISNRKYAIRKSLNMLTTGVLQNPNRKWMAVLRIENSAQKRESNEP